jgi:type III secretory pathway component EscU
MKEKVISDYVGLLLPLNHFMFDALNDKIIQLQESGIICRWTQFPYLRANATEEDPVPLTLGHLQIWFQLLVFLLLISIFFFFVEVLMSKMSRIKKRNAKETVKRQKRKPPLKKADNVIHRENSVPQHRLQV